MVVLDGFDLVPTGYVLVGLRDKEYTRNIMCCGDKNNVWGPVV